MMKMGERGRKGGRRGGDSPDKGVDLPVAALAETTCASKVKLEVDSPWRVGYLATDQVEDRVGYKLRTSKQSIEQAKQLGFGHDLLHRGARSQQVEQQQGHHRSALMMLPPPPPLGVVTRSNLPTTAAIENEMTTRTAGAIER